jgi:TPR repeat protein
MTCRLYAVCLSLVVIAGCGPTDENAESNFELTRKAAEQGDADAQHKVGVAYFFGNGVPEDKAEGVKWFRKAAEQGDADAQSNLAFAYSSGRGVPEDDAEAVKWWLKAAEQGHATAQTNLGVMYDIGAGVPEDDVEAYAWYSVVATDVEQRGAVNKRDEIKRGLTPDQLTAAQKRAAELFNQINANKAK